MYTKKVDKLKLDTLKMPNWFKIKAIYWLAESFMVIGVALEKDTPENECMPLIFEIVNEFKADFVGLNALDSLTHT